MIDLACYGDNELPGIFTFFQPMVNSNKLRLRAKAIWRSNYWKILQKLVQCVLILSYSEALTKERVAYR